MRSLVAATTLTLLATGVVVLAQGPGRAGRGGPPANLPDGAGKDQVQALCSACHPLTMITNARGYDEKGWDELTAGMIALPPDVKRPVLSYLAVHFPRRPGGQPVVVAGPTRVTIQEWQVPSRGSRPHDPLAAADGSIWWTGQWANVLGRLDPRTGAMKEFPLKTPQSGPHGLAEDAAGNIWYTGNGAALIGKLNPRTGQVTEYPMPDPAARDPHTPVFARSGMLWFSVQQGNMMGRLDPNTGAIRLVTMPTPRSLPYGVAFTSKDVPFVVLFGTNKIASLDPQTLQVKEYTLPNPASRPRRLAISSDDLVWYADYSRGFLGRLNPVTGEVKEWPSPSGPDAQPYGIAVAKGAIWYNESGPRPNTMVRFDPKTETFESVIVPSGGIVVRNMMTTKNGNIAIASSGANKVGLVRID